MLSQRPTAIVYIDGLNLDRQLLDKHPEFKWLDPVRMCQILLPTHEIKLVRYFTSRIKPPANNQSLAINQAIYLQALTSLGERMSVSFGKMIRRDRVFPIAPLELTIEGKPKLARVTTIEEKGSDVALASFMVLDASKKEADMYILVSNDSDFEPTLRILREQVGGKIGLFSPVKRPSKSLLVAEQMLVKTIRESVLQASQLPDEIQTRESNVRRPQSWT